MNAWLFQDTRQKAKLGDKCPWSVGWYDPDGKKKSKTIGAKSRAEKFQRKTEGQLAAGTYQATSKTKWADLRAEYIEHGQPGATRGTRKLAEYAMDHFQRLIAPVKVASITTRTIAEYVTLRQAEPIRKNGPTVRPATVNRELRLRAVFRKANKWGYMPRVPEIEFLREPEKLATYVTPEHFALLYENAKAARWPDDGHFTTAEWWQALFVTAYMTGWRIGQILAVRRDDVNLDQGFAVSRAADNKGKRDQKIPLHPLVVDHLRKLTSFAPMIFTWDYPRRSLFDEFHAIQDAAGVKPEGDKARYGFHDLRRAFATMNADKLSADALQTLMQHRDYQTTQRYINMARQLNPAVANLFVPKLSTAATA